MIVEPATAVAIASARLALTTVYVLPSLITRHPLSTKFATGFSVWLSAGLYPTNVPPFTTIVAPVLSCKFKSHCGVVPLNVPPLITTTPPFDA